MGDSQGPESDPAKPLGPTASPPGEEGAPAAPVPVSSAASGLSSARERRRIFALFLLPLIPEAWVVARQLHHPGWSTLALPGFTVLGAYLIAYNASFRRGEGDAVDSAFAGCGMIVYLLAMLGLLYAW